MSDGAALKAVVFGDATEGGRGFGEEVDGVLKGLSDGKGFVDMSTIDADSRNEVAEAIQAKGGKFLEAPVRVNSTSFSSATLQERTSVRR